MDNFISEKFGTDNAASKQDSKMTMKQLEDLQEKTLETQATSNEAVHDEEGSEEEDIEEVEDYADFEEADEFKFERDEMNKEAEEFSPHKAFEEQLDHRYDKAEYYIINEDVDWGAIEKDPTQLFTVGNSKVGLDTIIFNLQPARFCPSFENGMCKIVQQDKETGVFKIACYAYQDERQYKVALQLRLRQMRFWDTHSAQEIFDKLKEFYDGVGGGKLEYATLMAKRDETKDHAGHPRIRSKEKTPKLKYIRFNQSGDLKDIDDAKKMDRVAELAKELGLITYTYTARRDILKDHKFQNVHIQGSGFLAITGLSQERTNTMGPKIKRGAHTLKGKVFQAFPSIKDKSGNLVEKIPNKLYYEDVMYSHLDKDGIPVKKGGIIKNPKFNKWSYSNEKGWYACRGDCNSCTACKAEEVLHIACKIHRPFQKIAKDWHDVEKVGETGYKVHQKFDPYERGAKGEPLKWSKEMETEYETNAEILRKELEFNKLSENEKAEFTLDKLTTLYNEYDEHDVGDSDDEELGDIEKKIKKWENRAQELNIPNWENLRTPYPNLPSVKKFTPKPKKVKKAKIKKEDIDKYGTEDEKKFLKEETTDEWKIKRENNLIRFVKLYKNEIDEHLFRIFNKTFKTDEERILEVKDSRWLWSKFLNWEQTERITNQTKEDIDTYGTEDEKKFLKEWVGKNANDPAYKVMDWNAYAKKLKNKTVAELYYMRKDAHEAAVAGDDLEKAGLPNNGGYYWDEVHMITDELRKRREDILKKPKVKKIPLDPEPELGNNGEEIKEYPEDDPRLDR